MIKLPLVSIITPTYNHEKYIGACIESVLAQRYTNWEMLIIDDGSTDETGHIVQEYAQIDSRIKYVYQSNIGIYRLAETYNRGLYKGKGKYVAILEGDDVWEQEKLTIQVQQLEQNLNCVLCWSRAYVIDSEGQRLDNIIPSKKEERHRKLFNNSPVGSILNILLLRNPIPALTIFARRDAIMSIGGFRQPFNIPVVDLPLLIDLSRLGEFSFKERPLGSWRSSIGQATKNLTVSITQSYNKLCSEEFEKSLQEDPDVLTFKTGELKSFHRIGLVKAHFNAGRYHLVRHEFKQGKVEFCKALRIGYLKPFKVKLGSVIGIVFSYMRFDIEKFVQIFSRKF